MERKVNERRPRRKVCRVMLAVLAVVVALPAAAAGQAESRPPNIVLMLSDNLGFGEIGVYGGGVLRGAPTPRLDRLAAEGMRFTNFNVEVECTPSRSALVTGRMPVRSGTWRAATPGLPGGLAPWEITLAEMLSDTQFARFVDGIVVPGPRDDALGQRALAPVEQRSLQALGGFGGGEVDQALPVEQQLVAPVAAVVAGQVQRDAVGRHRRDDDLVVEDAAPAGGGQLKLGHLLAERFGRAVVDADVHLRARDH